MRKVVAIFTVLIAAHVCSAQANVRTYSQEFQITYSSAAQAQSAVLTPTPVYGGKNWAFTARWDDNRPGNPQMHDLMAEYGYKGTFYLYGVNHPNYVESYAKDLVENGFTLGDHTLSHLSVNTLTPSQMFYEVMAVRVLREDHSEKPISSIAFPNGQFNGNAQTLSRVTEVVRRSGIHHSVYKDFAMTSTNPNVTAGEFSTSLMIAPGDNEIDRAAFDTNIAKYDTFPQVYRPISNAISLATHAAYDEEDDWVQMEQLLSDYANNPNWWYVNQNEYAAYENQVKFATIEKVSVDGATATYRITRATPDDIGASVPLTVAVTNGTVVGVQGVSNPYSHNGQALLDIGQSSSQTLPTKIDAIDNLTNLSSPTAGHVSSEFAGLTVFLHHDELTHNMVLDFINNGSETMENIDIALRLPLAYEDGVQFLTLASLAAGESYQEIIDPGAVLADPTLKDGIQYAVAEINFLWGSIDGRIYATTLFDGAELAPEPATMTLLILSGCAMLLRKRRN